MSPPPGRRQGEDRRAQHEREAAAPAPPGGDTWLDEITQRPTAADAETVGQAAPRRAAERRATTRESGRGKHRG